MKTLKTITIAGWGQSPESLKCIDRNAICLDYNKYENLEDFFASLDNFECETLIGWSLGGQLALRALELGAIKAKKLILLGTPYQFVSEIGVSKAEFAKMLDDYKNNPQSFLKQFHPFIAFGDSCQKQITKQLISQKHQIDYDNLEYYLQQLGSFSCDSLCFANVPKTYIVHGKCDHVVNFAQSQLFLDKIKNSELLAIENCAHAPHLHDLELIKNLL